MSGLPGLRSERHGIKFREARRLRELVVDVPGGAINSDAAALTVTPSEPSPYGQPFVMPPSLRGTKRDYRSPRLPHSGREPATRKRKAHIAADGPAAGWSADVNPAPADCALAITTAPMPSMVAVGTGISLEPMKHAGIGSTSAGGPEPQAPTERPARVPGGGCAYVGGRGSRTARSRSSRKAFTEAEKLYKKPQLPPQALTTTAKLPPMAGGHVAKPPAGTAVLVAGRGRPSPTRRTRSTSPTVVRSQKHVEPLSEGVHIWHAPALATEPRPPSLERSAEGRPGRRSPGRGGVGVRGARSGDKASAFQPRYGTGNTQSQSTDMEMEATSARLANLRVTPRNEQSMAWTERSQTTSQLGVVVPRPPASGGSVAAATTVKKRLVPIFVLPAELMLIVLRNLSQVPDLIRVCAVCKRLRQLAFHRRLWRAVEFHDDPRITPQFLHAIAVRNPRMVKLSVQSCKNVTDRAIFSVASACHSLREIDVSDCPYVTFQTLNIILGSLGELRRLNASGCEKNAELTITRNLPKLQEILISDCEVDDSTAQSIASHCPNLRKLDVSGSTLISGSTITSLVRCMHLCSVSFGDISASGGMGGGDDAMDSDSDADRTPLSSIKDEHIEMLATSCTSLRDIEITGCGSLTGMAITHLLSQCEQLQKLSLRSCDGLTDCTFPRSADASASFNLQALELQNCGYLTDQAAINIIERCPLLTDLNLYGCFGLTDGCIGRGDSLSKLQLLNLGNCRVGPVGVARVATAAAGLRVLIVGDEHKASSRTVSESAVTDEVLGCLGSHNPHLEYLDIYSSACTGAGLALLSSGCDELSAISLSNCPLMISLETIQPLPALQSLTVKDTPIRDDDIGTLIKACPRLGYLCIENPSDAVTGAALRLISQGLLCLNSLCLSGCSGIGNDVVLHPSPQLKRLSIYDCSKITPLSCLTIMVAAPKLQQPHAVTCERCTLLADFQLALPLLLSGLLRDHAAVTKRTDSDDSVDSPYPAHKLSDEATAVAAILRLVPDALSRQF